MDRTKVKLIREDIKKELAKIESKYNIQLSSSNASYTNTSVKFSIELIENDSVSNPQYARFEDEFNKTFHYSLKLGDQVTLRTKDGLKVAKLIGMQPNARKAPYVVECEGQLYRVELEKFNKV